MEKLVDGYIHNMERDRKDLLSAIESALYMLGQDCADQGCQGCAFERREAVMTLKSALKKAGNEDSSL